MPSIIQRVQGPEGLAVFIVWFPHDVDPMSPQMFDSRLAARIYCDLILHLHWDDRTAHLYRTAEPPHLAQFPDPSDIQQMRDEPPRVSANDFSGSWPFPA